MSWDYNPKAPNPISRCGIRRCFKDQKNSRGNWKALGKRRKGGNGDWRPNRFSLWCQEAGGHRRWPWPQSWVNSVRQVTTHLWTCLPVWSVVCLCWTEIGAKWRGGQRQILGFQKFLCAPKGKAVSTIHRLGGSWNFKCVAPTLQKDVICLQVRRKRGREGERGQRKSS